VLELLAVGEVAGFSWLDCHFSEQDLVSFGFAKNNNLRCVRAIESKKVDFHQNDEICKEI
jgi:hypothetical protein